MRAALRPLGGPLLPIAALSVALCLPFSGVNAGTVNNVVKPAPAVLSIPIGSVYYVNQGTFPTSPTTGNPSQVAVKNPGDSTVCCNTLFFTSQTGGGAVQAYDIALNTVLETPFWGGSGTTFAEGVYTSASLFNPVGIRARCDTGILYVAEKSRNVIRVLSLATGQTSTLAGDRATPANQYGGGGLNDDGTGTIAKFYQPTYLEIDAAGAKLYVSEPTAGRIRMVTTATGIVATLAGSLSSPLGLTFVADTLYFVAGWSSFMNLIGSGNTAFNLAGNYIGAFDATARANAPSAQHTQFAGKSLAGTTNGGGAPAFPYPNNDADGTNAEFCQPEGLIGGYSSPTQAYLYVADYANAVIRRIDASSGTKAVETLVGTYFVNGAAVTPLAGSGSSARMHGPKGVSFNGSCTLFVSDWDGHVIEQIALQDCTVQPPPVSCYVLPSATTSPSPSETPPVSLSASMSLSPSVTPSVSHSLGPSISESVSPSVSESRASSASVTPASYVPPAGSASVTPAANAPPAGSPAASTVPVGVSGGNGVSGGSRTRMASEATQEEIIGAAVGGSLIGLFFLLLLLICCCCPGVLGCGRRRTEEETKAAAATAAMVAPATAAVLVCPVCDNRMVTVGPKAPYCKHAKAHETNLKPVLVNVPV